MLRRRLYTCRTAMGRSLIAGATTPIRGQNAAPPSYPPSLALTASAIRSFHSTCAFRNAAVMNNNDADAAVMNNNDADAAVMNNNAADIDPFNLMFGEAEEGDVVGVTSSSAPVGGATSNATTANANAAAHDDDGIYDDDLVFSSMAAAGASAGVVGGRTNSKVGDTDSSHRKGRPGLKKRRRLRRQEAEGGEAGGEADNYHHQQQQHQDPGDAFMSKAEKTQMDRRKAIKKLRLQLNYLAAKEAEMRKSERAELKKEKKERLREKWRRRKMASDGSDGAAFAAAAAAAAGKRRPDYNAIPEDLADMLPSNEALETAMAYTILSHKDARADLDFTHKLLKSTLISLASPVGWWDPYDVKPQAFALDQYAALPVFTSATYLQHFCHRYKYAVRDPSGNLWADGVSIRHEPPKLAPPSGWVGAEDANSHGGGSPSAPASADGASVGAQAVASAGSILGMDRRKMAIKGASASNSGSSLGGGGDTADDGTSKDIATAAERDFTVIDRVAARKFEADVAATNEAIDADAFFDMMDGGDEDVSGGGATSSTAASPSDANTTSAASNAEYATSSSTASSSSTRRRAARAAKKAASRAKRQAARAEKSEAEQRYREEAAKREREAAAHKQQLWEALEATPKTLKQSTVVTPLITYGPFIRPYFVGYFADFRTLLHNASIVPKMVDIIVNPGSPLETIISRAAATKAVTDEQLLRAAYTRVEYQLRTEFHNFFLAYCKKGEVLLAKSYCMGQSAPESTKDEDMLYDICIMVDCVDFDRLQMKMRKAKQRGILKGHSSLTVVPIQQCPPFMIEGSTTFFEADEEDLAAAEAAAAEEAEREEGGGDYHHPNPNYKPVDYYASDPTKTVGTNVYIKSNSSSELTTRNSQSGGISSTSPSITPTAAHAHAPRKRGVFKQIGTHATISIRHDADSIYADPTNQSTEAEGVAAQRFRLGVGLEQM